MNRSTIATLTEFVAPGTYPIDQAHSYVGFVSRHLMVAKVRGRFERFSATLHVAERLEDSWVEAEIEAASITTGMPMRDDHLRSPDFLDAGQHPLISFRSTGVDSVSPETGRLRVTGELTIRGITRPITLDVEFEGLAPDMQGRTRLVATATGEIDREAYGITWNQALETGGFVVGRNLKIELELQAVQAAGEVAA